ncbi:MAG TPA: DsbA family protein [Solirubrobacteraceae bacterium]|nr:DsbA family protein [Solirubrobacteraceae bacterium]
MSAAVRYFTDPGCPPDTAWPQYDELRMIVLRPDRGEPWPQRGNDATIHACRAVVAARLRWPEREEAFLRRLQMLAGAGQMLDDSDTLELAAEQAGLPVAEIAAFCAEPEVEAALREDMALAAGRRCGEIDHKN